MVAQPPPAGVYVPVPTFFDAANRLDLETQGAHAIYLARAGITGIVVLGSTGELAAVAASERTTLVRGLRARLDDAGFRDYPLVAGTGAQAVEEVREQLVETAAAGAQWGMCLVPSYHAQVMAQDGIVDWFTAVADQSPIPILIYHYPSVSNNVQVAASCLIKLAQHPNIVGCKLSHGDVSRLAQVALNPTVQKTDFHVFTGLGQLLLPAMSVGCSGAIDAAAAFFPRTLVRLYALAAEPRPGNGQLAERQQLQLAVCCVEELLVRHGVVAVKEAVSRLRGFGAPHATRLPLAGGIPGGEAEWQKWTGALEALERIEASLDG